MNHSQRPQSRTTRYLLHVALVALGGLELPAPYGHLALLTELALASWEYNRPE